MKVDLSFLKEGIPRGIFWGGEKGKYKTNTGLLKKKKNGWLIDGEGEKHQSRRDKKKTKGKKTGGGGTHIM